MYVCMYKNVAMFILLVPGVKGSNVTIFENVKAAVVQIKRSGPLNSGILIRISTANGTAIG